MPARYEIAKTYPSRGPMQQYRLASSCSFACFRCHQAKTSKLVTVANGSWSSLLCNGCYGRLVALHDIKAGADPVEEKASKLADRLLELASREDVEAVSRLLLVRRAQARLLTAAGLRFLATSKVVAEGLSGHIDLDWSAAVIGLGKAFEVELVHRVVEPLRAACSGVDLSSDIIDKDLGSLARYCSGRHPTPPSIGSVRHALQTAENSKVRAASSPLVRAFHAVSRRWPKADWLTRADGGLAAIEELTTRYRNRAAHTDVLTKQDYNDCLELVAGNGGVLWELILSTSGRE